MFPQQRSAHPNMATLPDYATSLPTVPSIAMQNSTPSHAAAVVNPAHHQNNHNHSLVRNSSSTFLPSAIPIVTTTTTNNNNSNTTTNTTTKNNGSNPNNTSSNNTNNINRNKKPPHFILSLSNPLIHQNTQSSTSTEDAHEYQLIKHVIRCHLQKQQQQTLQQQQQQQQPPQQLPKRRRRGKKRERDDGRGEGSTSSSHLSSLVAVASMTPHPSASSTGGEDHRTAATVAAPAAEGMAQQRVLQKAKIKSLLERQETHQAILQKAEAEEERLKSQMVTLQSKYDARLAELLKQQQCGGDVVLWQKKKKKKKRQKQKKKEQQLQQQQQQQQRRQQDDHLTSDEDEEEDEVDGEKEVEVKKEEDGNFGGVTEPAVGKEEFEVSKKAKVKAILLLKQEQKEYTTKAKKAKESLAELERQWKKEDEERVLAWKIEDDERMMKDKEQKSIKCKQEPDTNDIVPSDVNPIQSTRKKRKVGEIANEEEEKADEEMDDNDNDIVGAGSHEESTSGDLSSILSNDAKNSTINSTTVGIINDSGTGDGGEKKLESERKTEDLKKKTEEVDDLNLKKTRMTWLLKLIIMNQPKKKKKV